MSRSGRDQRRVLDVVEPKAPDEYAVPDRTPRQIQSDQNVIELPATQEAAALLGASPHTGGHPGSHCIQQYEFVTSPENSQAGAHLFVSAGQKGRPKAGGLGVHDEYLFKDNS
jgi:hypothetical protein